VDAERTAADGVASGAGDGVEGGDEGSCRRSASSEKPGKLGASSGKLDKLGTLDKLAADAGRRIRAAGGGVGASEDLTPCKISGDIGGGGGAGGEAAALSWQPEYTHRERAAGSIFTDERESGDSSSAADERPGERDGDAGGSSSTAAADAVSGSSSDSSTSSTAAADAVSGSSSNSSTSSIAAADAVSGSSSNSSTSSIAARYEERFVPGASTTEVSS
jgi:hypothetical protein